MSGPDSKTPSDSDTDPPKKSTKKSTPPASAADDSTTSSSAGGASTGQATAAVSTAVTAVRERLIAGEQMALGGAALIAAVWIIWDLIFDERTISTFTLLIAVLMLLAIWVHRWGHYDFGNGYRMVVGVLGLALALFAVTNFLLVIRSGINAGAFELLGLLLYWIGGVAAGYGAWLVFRTREE